MTTATKKLRTTEEICDYLYREPSHVYHLLADWIRRGQVRIECGHDQWRPDWYSEFAWENRSWGLLFELALKVRGSNDFKLYYDPKQDFHHIDFTLDGVRYSVRWYKVYAIDREDGKTVTLYYNESGVEDFFVRGRYKEEKNWH